MLLPAFTRLCASWYIHFIIYGPLNCLELNTYFLIKVLCITTISFVDDYCGCSSWVTGLNFQHRDSWTALQLYKCLPFRCSGSYHSISSFNCQQIYPIKLTRTSIPLDGGPGHGPFRRNFVWEEALWPRSFATCATLFGTRSFSSTSEAMRWRSGFSSRSSTGQAHLERLCWRCEARCQGIVG